MRFLFKVLILFFLFTLPFNVSSQEIITSSRLIKQAEEEKLNPLETLRLYLTFLLRFPNASLDTVNYVQKEIGTIYQKANLHKKALEYFENISSPLSESEEIKMKKAASFLALQNYKEAEKNYVDILENSIERNSQNTLKILEKLNEVEHKGLFYEKALKTQKEISPWRLWTYSLVYVRNADNI